MSSFNFPVYKTKTAGSRQFKLDDPKERKDYFKLKAGKELEKIRKFLKRETFIAFLLGKKNSGKGTYSKLFMEAVGGNDIAHISIGDIVRNTHAELGNAKQKKELTAFLKERYRGFITIEQAMEIILGRDTTTLLPTEIILALVERQIDKLQGKALFIDGFPRNLDQISYSLYFRALMGYREDPDFFVFIDIPNTILDARLRSRVVCPICHTPRSPKLLKTKEVGYDEKSKTVFLKCDTSSCKGARMVAKEGDNLGIEAIRDRIELDEKVMQMLLDLQGVPKILLRNSVPVDQAEKMVNRYELTPAYHYNFDEKSKKIEVVEKPWTIGDTDGVMSYSLLPAPIAVSLIKQTVKVLDL